MRDDMGFGAIRVIRPVPPCSIEGCDTEAARPVADPPICEKHKALAYAKEQRLLQEERARAALANPLHPEQVRKAILAQQSHTDHKRKARKRKLPEKLDVVFIGGEMDGRTAPLYAHQVTAQVYYGEEYHARALQNLQGEDVMVMCLASLTQRGSQIIFESFLREKFPNV
jgi:hypothetical protein